MDKLFLLEDTITKIEKEIKQVIIENNYLDTYTNDLYDVLWRMSNIDMGLKVILDRNERLEDILDIANYQFIFEIRDEPFAVIDLIVITTNTIPSINYRIFPYTELNTEKSFKDIIEDLKNYAQINSDIEVKCMAVKLNDLFVKPISHNKWDIRMNDNRLEDVDIESKVMEYHKRQIFVFPQIRTLERYKLTFRIFYFHIERYLMGLYDRIFLAA